MEQLCSSYAFGAHLGGRKERVGSGTARWSQTLPYTRSFQPSLCRTFCAPKPIVLPMSLVKEELALDGRKEG